MITNDEEKKPIYGPALPANVENDSKREVHDDKKLDHEEFESIGIDVEKLDKMSDDEAILELDKVMSQNDEVVEKDYLSALLDQGERLVYYHVENIYHNEETRAYKNRFKLRKNPPVLIVRDEDDNEVRFYLTENLTDELSETLKQVKRAYYGFNGPQDMNVPDKLLDKIKYYIKKKPLKISVTILIVLFIVSLVL